MNPSRQGVATPNLTSGGPLMTLPEVVQRLRVSRTMLYRLMRSRELVPVHIGRAIRFEAQAVDAFIRKLADKQEQSVPENPWRLIRSGR